MKSPLAGGQGYKFQTLGTLVLASKYPVRLSESYRADLIPLGNLAEYM